MAATFLATLALLLAISAALSTGYLLRLLAFATRRRSPAPAPTPCHIAVIIPAHNEEDVIHLPIESLQAQTWQGALTVYVVADNCTDHTACTARACGATVLERTNPDERGKGYALAWAVQTLLAQPHPPDAFCIVDADTTVAPDFIAKIAAHLPPDGTAIALQGRYGVSNPEASWRSALMSAAFDLVNHVRLLGCDNSGGFIGLKGNGMLFSRATFEQVPWTGKSITEDLDYSLSLVEQGIPIRYVPEAMVQSAMPTHEKQARSQRDRWERGRYQLVKEKALPLLGQGLKKRNGCLIDGALGLLTPPLAELALLLILAIAALAVAWQMGAGTALVLTGVSLLAFVLVGLPLYILGGMRLSGASQAAYRALFMAPFYALWKLGVYASKIGKHTDNEWVRTERK
jgi:cellulose synthase/poly-beta-1,6-N-acetylglucosamine synthase-like glycosyltransferase